MKMFYKISKRVDFTLETSYQMARDWLFARLRNCRKQINSISLDVGLIKHPNEYRA